MGEWGNCFGLPINPVEAATTVLYKLSAGKGGMKCCLAQLGGTDKKLGSGN